MASEPDEGTEPVEWGDEFYIGMDFGAYETTEEAIRAYDAGEIDLWVELMRPKTGAEWKAFDAKHPENLHERWKPKNQVI